MSSLICNLPFVTSRSATINRKAMMGLLLLSVYPPTALVPLDHFSELYNFQFWIKFFQHGFM